MENKRCHCGQPLHYTVPAIEAFMRKLVAEAGEFVDITVVGGKTYRVPRHYIALHGINAADLPTLGFEEVRRQ